MCVLRLSAALLWAKPSIREGRLSALGRAVSREGRPSALGRVVSREERAYEVAVAVAVEVAVAVAW